LIIHIFVIFDKDWALLSNRQYALGRMLTELMRSMPQMQTENMLAQKQYKQILNLKEEQVNIGSIKIKWQQ